MILALAFLYSCIKLLFCEYSVGRTWAYTTFLKKDVVRIGTLNALVQFMLVV